VNPNPSCDYHCASWAIDVNPSCSFFSRSNPPCAWRSSRANSGVPRVVPAGIKPAPTRAPIVGQGFDLLMREISPPPEALELLLSSKLRLTCRLGLALKVSETCQGDRAGLQERPVLPVARPSSRCKRRWRRIWSRCSRTPTLLTTTCNICVSHADRHADGCAARAAHPRRS